MMPPFMDAERLAGLKVTVGADELMRWAQKLASAAGTISGTHIAIKARGCPAIPQLDEEVEQVEEGFKEIAARIAEAAAASTYSL